MRDLSALISTRPLPPSAALLTALVGGVGVVTLGGTAAAQIAGAGVPAALELGLDPAAAPVVFVAPPDVGAYLAEDEVRGPFPLRYGALLDVDVELSRDGLWDLLPDGRYVWRFRVLSPGAHSIGLEFSEFTLPEGGQVFLYDETLGTVHGAYGAENNQPNGQLQIAPFPGDSVIFEYVQPAVVHEAPRLRLGTVIYDYRGLFELEQALAADDGAQGGSGAGGSCLVNVNCPDGDPYPLQKRATLRTLSGGSLCSGALINNTANSGVGYVLTAWHCGQGSNTVFRFNYQSSTCGGTGGPTSQQVSGCTPLLSYQESDGRLLRINNTIPGSYNPYFAGWSRSTTNPTFALSMHHPSGGPKKICIDPNGAFKTTTPFSGIGNVISWRCDWTVGDTEGGSSGGPLFDQNGRLRGGLTGGPGGTCPQIDYYGRLYTFWNNVDLAQYLDPQGTGTTEWDGFDPQNPGGGGGPTGLPEISAISPAFITAVNPVSPLTVTLTGSGFDGLTDVKIDGVSISTFPPQFTVVNDTTLTISLGAPFQVGSRTIEVLEGSASDAISLPVTFNLTPTIDLISSDPNFLITLVPLQIYMGGLPNDLHFLLVSGSNLPTVVPGIFSAAIGNNFASLFLVNNYVVNPATGWTLATLPVSGLPIGTKLYFQSGSISALFPALPLTMSNVESGTVLF
jgi:hypothetical protein